jgi:hypothetical protein
VENLATNMAGPAFSMLLVKILAGNLASTHYLRELIEKIDWV